MATLDTLDINERVGLVIRHSEDPDMAVMALGGRVENGIEYDFIDANDGALRAKVSLAGSSQHHPRLSIKGAEVDKKNPGTKPFLRFCGQAGIGLMVRETLGSILGGITYSDTESDLSAREMFGGPRQEVGKRHHFIGQAALRQAVPDGLLNRTV